MAHLQSFGSRADYELDLTARNKMIFPHKSESLPQLANCLDILSESVACNDSYGDNTMRVWWCYDMCIMHSTDMGRTTTGGLPLLKRVAMSCSNTRIILLALPISDINTGTIMYGRKRE